MHRVMAEVVWGMGEVRSAKGELEDLEQREGRRLAREAWGRLGEEAWGRDDEVWPWVWARASMSV